MAVKDRDRFSTATRIRLIGEQTAARVYRSQTKRQARRSRHQRARTGFTDARLGSRDVEVPGERAVDQLAERGVAEAVPPLRQVGIARTVQQARLGKPVGN